MSTLAYYTQRAFTVLAIGEAGHMDILLTDRLHKERQFLHESVIDLTLQRDMYQQEVKKAYISLTEIGDALSAFNFLDYLIS